MSIASQRLVRLAEILSADEIARAQSSVTLDRIRGLTAELAQRTRQEPDDIDRVVTRLLLEEFAQAMAHCRAAANAAAERTQGASQTIRLLRHYVRKRKKAEEQARPHREKKNLRSGIDAAPAQPSSNR